jgi:host cell surface-exposed lipoprotein
MRPWYKKKRFIVPLGLVALTIAGTAMSGSDSSKPTASASTSQVSRSAPAAQRTAAANETPAAQVKPEMTTSQKNAVESATNYIELKAFSKKGLTRQLSSSAGDDFPRADARFAVNHIHVDWNEQAVKSAREYLTCSRSPRAASSSSARPRRAKDSPGPRPSTRLAGSTDHEEVTGSDHRRPRCAPASERCPGLHDGPA